MKSLEKSVRTSHKVHYVNLRVEGSLNPFGTQFLEGVGRGAVPVAGWGLKFYALPTHTFPHIMFTIADLGIKNHGGCNFL